MKWLFLVSLVFFVSCRKQQFEPCPEYSNIVGEWKSIGGDGVDYITFYENGKMMYESSLERNRTYKFWTCEWKSNSYFKFFINRKQDAQVSIFPNATFDTLVRGIGLGAYNHGDSSMINYDRKFVKIQ